MPDGRSWASYAVFVSYVGKARLPPRGWAVCVITVLFPTASLE